MSNELAVVNNFMSLTEMPKDEVRRAMDKNFLASLVRQHPTLPEPDFINFINKCQLTGADPRLNQVYLIVHNAWNSEKRVAEPRGTTIFAYQFFMQMAQRTGELEDFGVDTVPEIYTDLVTGQERKSVTATAWVKRKGYNRITYKARFWEFAKTDKNGALAGNWKVSPYLMLEKCAIANAMRWAFPETLSGIYTSEEMTKDGNEPINVTPSQPTLIPRPMEQDKEYIPTHSTDGRKLEPLGDLPDNKPNPEIVAKIKQVTEDVRKNLVIEEEKPPEKIDFAGRDIEDLRSELIEFLTKAPQLLFDRIGKTREYMIEKVEFEKNLEGMKQKYSIIMKFI